MRVGVGLAILCTGCSLSSSHQRLRQLEIRIDGTRSPTRSLLGNFYIPGRALFTSAPSAVSSFDCLGVNVIAADIPDANSADNRSGFNLTSLLNETSYCSYPGITSDPIPNTVGTHLVSLSVPTGPQRLIQMVGIVDSGSVCDSEQPIGELGSTASGSNVFEIGRAVVDLFTSQAVTLPDTYDTLSPTQQQVRQMSCGNGGNSGYLGLIGAEQAMVGYWPLVDPTGSSLAGYGVDSQGNPPPIAESLTYTGGVTLAQVGPLIDGSDTTQNFGVSLDGTTGKIVAADSDIYNFSSGFSVEAWFKSSTLCAAGAPALVDLESGGLTFITLSCDSVGLSFGFGDVSDQAPTVNATASIYDGNWHYIVGTWTPPDTIAIYVDATLAASSTLTPAGDVNLAGASGTINLGWNKSTNHYLPAGAELSQVALYNQALTQTQINNHFDSAGH